MNLSDCAPFLLYSLITDYAYTHSGLAIRGRSKAIASPTGKGRMRTWTAILLCMMAVATTGVVARYGAEQSEMRRQAILRSMAVSFISALNDNDVTYWVDFGTLLGIIRDGDVILGDNDVDISIGNDEGTLALMDGPVRTRLQAQGYVLERMDWGPAYRVRKLHALFRYRYFIGVDITEKDGDTIIFSEGPSNNIASALVGTPKRIPWPRGAIQVKVPDDVHGALVSRYGKDYMTPIMNEKGRAAPKNRKWIKTLLEGPKRVEGRNLPKPGEFTDPGTDTCSPHCNSDINFSVARTRERTRSKTHTNDKSPDGSKKKTEPKKPKN